MKDSRPEVRATGAQVLLQLDHQDWQYGDPMESA